uniref:Uncharacterized protein n=1 Tax=Plectus sambesii TaxID=2011161 RepID=A0A914VVK2_9BILA
MAIDLREISNAAQEDTPPTPAPTPHPPIDALVKLRPRKTIASTPARLHEFRVCEARPHFLARRAVDDRSATDFFRRPPSTATIASVNNRRPPADWRAPLNKYPRPTVRPARATVLFSPSVPKSDRRRSLSVLLCLSDGCLSPPLCITCLRPATFGN